MADTKFTEGPFIIEPINNGHTYQITTPDPDFRVVSEAAEHADALLQAAAPELYAEIERAMKARIELIESGDCGFWDPNDDGEVLSMRKALAKARGEAA